MTRTLAYIRYVHVTHTFVYGTHVTRTHVYIRYTRTRVTCTCTVHTCIHVHRETHSCGYRHGRREKPLFMDARVETGSTSLSDRGHPRQSTYPNSRLPAAGPSSSTSSVSMSEGFEGTDESQVRRGTFLPGGRPEGTQVWSDPESFWNSPSWFVHSPCLGIR